MVALTLRSVKGSPLTNTEIDTNFSNLNTVAEAALPKTGGTMAGVLAFLAGTVSAPGLAVAGDLNTGIDGVSADVLGVIAGGTIVQTWGVGTSTLTGAVAISRSATNSTGGLTLVNQNTSGWGTSLSFQGTLSGTIDTARILSQHPTAGQGELQFQTALSSALGTRMTIAPTGATTITVADATSGVPLTLSTPSSSAYSLRLLNRTYSTSLPVFSYFPQNDGVFLQGTDQATAFRIYTNGFANPRLSITATGDVGIGTTSPSTLFHVNGVTTLGGNLLTSADATHDLGTSGSGRFRDAYFSRNLVAGAGVSGGSYLRVNGTNSGYIALGTADDVLLYRDVANVLALRNSTNGQTFRVYGTYTDASNWERMSYGSNGVIAMQAAGTGSMRDLNLQGAQVVLSTGSSPVGRWLLLAAGHFVPQADNTYDLGSTGNRIRSGYFGTSVVLGTGVTAASLLHLSGATGATLNTIYEPSGWSGLKSRVGNQYRGDGLVSSVNVRLTSATAGTLDDATQPGSGLILLSDGSLSLVNATAGAGSRTFAQIFGVSSAGVVTLYNNVLRSADNTYDDGALGTNRVRSYYAGTSFIAPLGAVGTPSFTFTGDANTGMWSPAADTLAWSTAGTERLRVSSSGHLLPGADATYDLGLSGSGRFRDAHLSRYLRIGGAAPAGSSGLSAIQAFGNDWGLIGAGVLTDATTKAMRIGVAHYTNAEKPLTMLGGSSTSTGGGVSIGGGTSSGYAATQLNFYTAANNTTVTGTLRWAMDSNGLLLPGADATYDFGTAANRIRDGWFSRDVTAAGIELTGHLLAHFGTAIASGGVATPALAFSTSGAFGVYFGAGAPTISAAKGSLYLRSDGSGTSDRMYVNTNGATAWTAVTTAT